MNVPQCPRDEISKDLEGGDDTSACCIVDARVV